MEKETVLQMKNDSYINIKYFFTVEDNPLLDLNSNNSKHKDSIQKNIDKQKLISPKKKNNDINMKNGKIFKKEDISNASPKKGRKFSKNLEKNVSKTGKKERKFSKNGNDIIIMKDEENGNNNINKELNFNINNFISNDLEENSFAKSYTPKKEIYPIYFSNSQVSANSDNNSFQKVEKMDKLNTTINTLDLNSQESEYKVLSNNKNIKEELNIFFKENISKLNNDEYEYDTFCQVIIKTGLNNDKMSLSKYSDNFPSSCCHELCSKLPALEPSIISIYQNKKKKFNIDIKEEVTSHLIFPYGIKLCIKKDYYNDVLIHEPMINTIFNETGEIYYLSSLTYFRKISIQEYDKIFNINPIKVYNKFKQENSDTENKEPKNDKNDILNYKPNDIIYVPECISLVSRFPYFNQLSECLKIILNMLCQKLNGENNKQVTNNISQFINHIINQVPVGSNRFNVSFYSPLNIEPIKLYNPFVYNFGNFTLHNIFSILNFFFLF